MKRNVIVMLAVVLFCAACASEDQSIINPPPNSNNVSLRLFNMVPDGASRRMLLELNIQTSEVPSASFSAVVGAPSDSSFIEILRGSASEYRSDKRMMFIRNSVYDVFTIASPNAAPVLDTIILHNATAALLTTNDASVRLVNMVPDTLRKYRLRIGCPSGAILHDTVGYGGASLYASMAPGQAVFSLMETTAAGERLLGILEGTLKDRAPYSIITYTVQGDATPQVMFIEETDLTPGATRPLLPVTARTADFRIVNTASEAVTVQHSSSGQPLAVSLPQNTVSAWNNVPTCISDRPDGFDVSFTGGATLNDSISLGVRSHYTMVTADSAGAKRSIIIAPQRQPADAASKALVRVVHVAPSTGRVGVSIGGRSDASQSNGISAGLVLARSLGFGAVSDVQAVAPGTLPLTITTSMTPTAMLQVASMSVEAGGEYLIILTSNPDGTIAASLLSSTTGNGPLTPAGTAALVTVVNGSPTDEFETVSIGTMIENGKLYYRNTMATVAATGSTSVQIGGVSTNMAVEAGKRSLAIYAEGGGTPGIIGIVSDPLLPQFGRSMRRVINATEDVALVSVAYDSIPKSDPGAERMADRVAYGTASPVNTVVNERRGTLFFYDSDAFTQIYTLPVQYAPLGNCTSLIVTGNKTKGYEVIVLQEF